MEQKSLTTLEKRWVLYDVGNSAFTMLVSTLFPIYFNSLAESAGVSEVDYLAYWGYATSVATILVVLIGPVLGAMADIRNFKKPLFSACMCLGVLGCAALSLPTMWMAFLAVFVLARVGYNTSLIFYDCDDKGAHGYGFFPWLCVGVYWKLYSVCLFDCSRAAL